MRKMTEKEFIVPIDDIGVDGAYFGYTELIRCKDCKHFRIYCRVVDGIRTDYACDILDEHYDPYGKKRVALDDYCRWAERKQ